MTPGTNENLSLTQAELDACQPIGNGQAVRAFCPFHGSDKQRSLRVDTVSGRFNCFACGAWGYLAEHREQRRRERAIDAGDGRRPLAALRLAPAEHADPRPPATPATARHRRPDPEPVRPDLAARLAAYQAALPGSLGERYLRWRRIPLELAERSGVGYAAPGTWPGRDWKHGRLVIPHTDPTGQIVNLYGRAIGDDRVPKEKRHDHLPGQKGAFNAPALRDGDGPLFVCEGAFDALALLAAGCRRVVAIFGVAGWRWEWARGVREIVFALDADPAGQGAWRELARAAALRGKRIAFLPPESYGGKKDVSEAWIAGVLHLGDWPADPAPAPATDLADSTAAASILSAAPDDACPDDCDDLAVLGEDLADIDEPADVTPTIFPMNERARWTADPRPDLADDAERWRRLLLAAWDLDGGRDWCGPVYLLRALRWSGVRLVPTADGGLELAGPDEPDGHLRYLTGRLRPQSAIVDRLLTAIAGGAQQELEAFA